MIITDIKKLRQKSEPVKELKELDTLFEKLDFELFTAGGVGLSGIQIDIPLRIAIINYRGEYYRLFNAEIIEWSGTLIMDGEGCLSIPGVYKKTRRHKKVTVRNGDGKIYNFEGILAVVAQHEIGHWNGYLFTDYLVKE